MVQVNDDETLRRFVIRARRVQAHSLVQDRDGLRRHAEGRFEGHIEISGRMLFTRRLPEDEEVFESLASRVRPLTVKSEPVFYETVFEAIDRLLGPGSHSGAHREQLAQLRQAWQAAELQGTQPQGYAVQMARIDGTEATGMVSDTQLAAAWLYADLVHADAKGPKAEALAFPMRERYAAAVRLFSHLAALTVATLRVIESLRADGSLSVAESPWEEDVVVGATEFVEEARGYVAPIGSAFPDMRDSPEFGEEWTRFTVTELLRQDPANHVRVLLAGDDGSPVASYDAAVVLRREPEESLAWDVLVAGSVLFKFAFDLDGDQVVGVRTVACEVFDSTNALRLASTQLRIQLHHAASIAFAVQDRELFSLSSPPLSAGQLRQLEVVAETLGDVLAIERLSGQELDTCDQGFGDRQRVLLRIARLIWEGHIVRSTRYPISVSAPPGHPPRIILTSAAELDVGGARVPMSRTLMRHPDMVVSERGDDDGVASEGQKYTIRPPEDGRFMAWSPDQVEVQNDDDLVVTASWDLLGIDEADFRY